MTEEPVSRRRDRNTNYPIAIRLQAVRLFESGVPRREVLRRFGICGSTLNEWRRAHAKGQLTCPMPFPRFTQAQRDHVAQQLLSGRLTPDEALKKYGLRLKKTLRLWVAAYQTTQTDLPPPAPPPPPPGQVLPDAATLAAQLQQAQWQLRAQDVLIDQAEARYNIAIRKKAGAKPSN